MSFMLKEVSVSRRIFRPGFMVFFLLVLILISPGFAIAEEYYVKLDGNDNLDGRSDATAWRSITKVNSFKFASGDDVYFKCGETWNGVQLVVDWGGSSQNRTIIGAYYLDNDKEVHGARGNKPIIDGNHTVPDEWSGLVQVLSDYVTVQDLRIINSEGMGLRFLKCDNGNVYRVDTSDTYRSGIILVRANYQGGKSVVNGCSVTRASDKSLKEGGICPAALQLHESKNITVSDNIVYENYFEGIGIYAISKGFDNAGYSTIENNVVYDCRKIGIYIGNTRNNTVRYNLIYGTNNPNFYGYLEDGNYYPGDALYVNDENKKVGTFIAQENKFYGNLIARCRAGILIGANESRSVFKNSVVANNTIVDCHIGMHIVGSSASNSLIINNIIWGIDNTTLYRGSTRQPGITFKNNMWSSPVSGDPAKSAIFDNPQLLKITGWDSLKGGAVTGREFALQDKSAAINAGEAFDAQYYNYIGDLNQSVVPNKIILLNQNEQGSGWEIGGDIHVENQPSKFINSPPQNLRIKSQK
jgi:parallel beta-helix repeat protein